MPLFAFIFSERGTTKRLHLPSFLAKEVQLSETKVCLVHWTIAVAQIGKCLCLTRISKSGHSWRMDLAGKPPCNFGYICIYPPIPGY